MSIFVFEFVVDMFYWFVLEKCLFVLVLLYKIFCVIICIEKVGCLFFVYNMFGCNVNKLFLFLEDFGLIKIELWLKIGN